MWYEHEYMIFVFGHNINEKTGIAAKYTLVYGFRDPDNKSGFHVEMREVLPFIIATQAFEYFGMLGYEFFHAGSEDPENLIGAWI